MLRSRLSLFLLLSALLLTTVAQPSTTAAQPSCTFTLGFQALRDQIPDVIGACLENEHGNVANGVLVNLDTLQRTSRGLLVWRQTDNWTAFTDGYRTWINGPNGVQERLNTQRFLWEGGPNKPAVAVQSSALPGSWLARLNYYRSTPTPTAQLSGEPWMGNLRFGYDREGAGAVPAGGTLSYQKGSPLIILADYRNIPSGSTFKWNGTKWDDSQKTQIPTVESTNSRADYFTWYTPGSVNEPIGNFRGYHFEAAVSLNGKEMLRGQIFVK